MFIKKLTISNSTGIIREINFENGLNLIIDNTPTNNKKLTGNNVGKTTILKLIYFCLGGEGKDIYTDEENNKSVYDEVKNYLIDTEVFITLILVNDLEDEKSKQIIIERNFLKNKKAKNIINGTEVSKKDFQQLLATEIFPTVDVEKPTFKQIISHNIRYKDDSINQTLKTLHKFTTDDEYESLYLYLLGCTFNAGAKKEALNNKITQENTYKARLEKRQTKNAYEVLLTSIENDINELNRKKSLLNLNETLEQDLANLNEIKYKINKSVSTITKLKIRKDIIVEAKEEMEKNISEIDAKQLNYLYNESQQYLENLHKTFEQLLNYHNTMIVEKVKFITQELPSLQERIDSEEKNMQHLRDMEKELSLKISKSDSFADLENIIIQINEKYRLKGEYEQIISQIIEAETNIENLESELNNISQVLYSDDFEKKLKTQIDKFNTYFSKISNELYGEKYLLKFDKQINKNTNKPVYKFSAFNQNMSSGKKQGEILCFDLAYIKFADAEKIPCLHFLLNDKKELMHDNQLSKVADFVKKNNIQLIISILKDKLPCEVINNSNIAIELSQNDKLFRI